MVSTGCSSTRTFQTSVVPNVVLASPGRLAPEAKRLAMPSVAPANTGTPVGRPLSADAVAETWPTPCPEGTTEGSNSNGTPADVTAPLQRFVSGEYPSLSAFEASE